MSVMRITETSYHKDWTELALIYGVEICINTELVHSQKPHTTQQLSAPRI